MPGSGAFPDITLYEYDADGNRTRVTEYRGDEVISESVYTYDAQGRTASYAPIRTANWNTRMNIPIPRRRTARCCVP